jgi:hypothetical protein
MPKYDRYFSPRRYHRSSFQKKFQTDSVTAGSHGRQDPARTPNARTSIARVASSIALFRSRAARFASDNKADHGWSFSPPVRWRTTESLQQGFGRRYQKLRQKSQRNRSKHERSLRQAKNSVHIRCFGNEESTILMSQ